jgi:SNF2 family DNA or RNA helicase
MPPELRSYQKEAATQAFEQGAFLFAMTMGSGKTATSLATAEMLVRSGEAVSGAVFVLNSTKYQWEREIKQWTDGTVQVIDGDKAKRSRQYRKAHRYRYNVLNYECAIHDWDLIATHLPIDFIICDEVTALKSFTSKRSKRLKEMGKYTDYRFGLSGQPVENRPEELFSIMEFIDPEVLGPFHRFDATFIKRNKWGKPIKYRNLKLLRDTVAPHMFRRSREDLAEFLPKIVTIDTPVHMDDWSATLYDELRVDVLTALDALTSFGGGFDIFSHYGKADGGDDMAGMGKLMGLLTVMRLLCDHPQLVVRSAERFDDPEVQGGSEHAAYLLQTGRLDKAPDSSPKLAALMEKIESALAEDQGKVVVFSGFTKMLDIISHALKKKRIPFARIDGSVTPKDRDDAIVRFNGSKNCNVFLSSDAGAYGVNLDRGSYLISYDLPWSSGSYAQRVARIDRLSSTHRTITIDSLFCSGTIEDRQYAMLQQKRAISDAVLDGKFDPEGVMTLDLSTLRDFMSS